MFLFGKIFLNVEENASLLKSTIELILPILS